MESLGLLQDKRAKQQWYAKLLFCMAKNMANVLHNPELIACDTVIKENVVMLWLDMFPTMMAGRLLHLLEFTINNDLKHPKYAIFVLQNQLKIPLEFSIDFAIQKLQ